MKRDKVLVVGVGAIGMAITLFAVQRGAEVTVTDPNDSRADFCVRVLGAERAIPRGNQTAALMSELTGGEGYDVVFDATGDPGAMEAGFAHVAHGGRYVLVSIVSADIRFNDPEFHKRETTLLASRNATIDDFAAVIAAIRNGDLPTQELHTHSAPLEDLGAVIRDWATADAGVIKALVELN
jgi:2-desacetyl-2-hydroxyethyl bacteriochlorophyllide A dehydrogenase